jgi:hypothetical protein
MKTGIQLPSPDGAKRNLDVIRTRIVHITLLATSISAMSRRSALAQSILKPDT